MKKLNKKGFTLVELLAVIVILAVVMLMAVTAVGPLMAKSRKSSLGTEGVTMVNAAKTAYQAEQMKNGDVTSTSAVCFDLAYLYSEGYFEKGVGTVDIVTANNTTIKADDYVGSVLITPNGNTYTYKFWITNGTYTFENADPNTYDATSAANHSDEDVLNNCGDATDVVMCTGSACSKTS